MRKLGQVLKYLFTALLLGQLLFSVPSSAEEIVKSASISPSSSQEKNQKCCGPDCTCGCLEGGECHCDKSKEKKCCGPDCTCGCLQGGECHCDKSKRKKCCGPDCTCGCLQGGECHCDKSKEKKCCGPDCTCGCQQGEECHCNQPGEANSSTDGNVSIEVDVSSFSDLSDDDSCDETMPAEYVINDPQDETIRPETVDPVIKPCEPCGQCGVWLPENPVLFRPFMADPREIDYSVGWRFNDDAMTKNIIDVSFGDTFPIYRWCDVWPWDGDLQVELEGAVWATFDPCTYSAPLMNADYYVGVPVSYAIDRWQFRLRGFHISSHIGDEFLLNHPDFDRRNASAEYLDFFISHDLTEEIRLYGGLGFVVQQDEEFETDRFYSAVGAELRLLNIGFLDCKDMLYGCPIFAMHFRQNGEFRHHIDATYIIGYEFGKLCGLYRKLRFFAEYHDGYSVEGQYFKIPTNYLSFRASYGF